MTEFGRGRCLLLPVLLCALLAFARTGARADDLVSGLSTDLIQITSNFSGADVVVFGAIEVTDTVDNGENRDVVVVIRGPDVNFTVRRKQRILGIWINTEQIPFTGMPGYYFLASTKPLDQIASPATLQRFHLGTGNVEATIPPKTDPREGGLFRTAAVRTLTRQQLYGEAPAGIEFLSRSLFRARIPVPATVPPGQYRAEVYLFHAGTIVSAQSSPLFIDQTGFERQVYNFANRDALPYGMVAVLMAFTLGWLGFVLFRQR